MLRSVLGPALKWLASGVMVLVVLIFMLAGREDLRNRVIRLAGTDRMDLTTNALDEAANRVSKYLSMQLIVNCCFGLLIGAGLYVIGVPNPLLWGALAMLLRFIPYVGAWIAASAPLLLAFAIEPGWGKLAWTGGLFLGAELVIGNIIEPLLYGSSTGVAPVALVLAAIFWTWLWGPTGLLLSTPLTVCLAVIGLHVPQFRLLHVLLGDEPVLAPEARFYQRMLALDRHEAEEIVESFLKDKTLSAAYGQLMVPSLIYAKEDLSRGRLSQTRENFVLETISELVNELADEEEDRLESGREAGTIPQARITEAEPVVAVLGAGSRTDAIGGSMLAKLLAHRGAVVRGLPGDANAETDKTDPVNGRVRIICISAVPPIGWRRVRHLCKRLRLRFPDMKLLLGLWGAKDNLAELRESLSTYKVDSIFTSFEEAVAAIEGLSGIEAKESSLPQQQPETRAA
jgi:hypothetical protein